jgi:hypothetical protein
MPKLTEPNHKTEGIQFEVEQDFNREEVLFVQNATRFTGISPVARITASGKYTYLAPAAVDGSQTLAGFIIGPLDASGGDTKAIIIARGPATLRNKKIDWRALSAPQIAAAKTAALALGIKVLESVGG